MSERVDYPYDVFISYSSSDQEWVWDWLIPRLRGAGLAIYTDLDFEVGVEKMVNIEKAVTASQHTLLVLTPAWAASEWQSLEGLLARSEDPVGHRRRTIPLLLERCTPHRSIARLNYADFTDVEERERQCERLVATLRGHRHRTAFGPPLGALLGLEAPTNFIFPRNPYFVGREEELAILHELLDEPTPLGVSSALVDPRATPKVAGLTGMGGIGKSQLVVEYIYRYRDAYPGGYFWINAAEPLGEGFAHIGRTLCGDGYEKPWRELIRIAADHLRSDPDILLVLDNLPDPMTLNFPVNGVVVPAALPCRVLFTTRRRDLPGYRTLAVDRLPSGQALRLLLRGPGRQPILDTAHPEHETARRICAVLGYLPLALELAAAYLAIAGAQVTLTGYLERLGRYGALSTVDDLEDLEVVVRSPSTRHDSVTPTLRSQWNALVDKGARLLLQIAALLPEAEMIPAARLGLLAGISDRAEPGFRSPLDKALQHLYDYSLLEALEAGQVRLHPLVREFTERHTPDFNREHLSRRACFNLTNAYGDPVILEHHILHRPQGIDDVMGDVRETLAFSPKQTAITTFLDGFYRFLDLEAHNLRTSQAKSTSGFVLQQLQNRAASENMGAYAMTIMNELRSRTAPYLIHRHPIAGEPPVLIRTLRGHTNAVYACAVTRDGKKAVSASLDGTLRVWDLATGREIATMQKLGSTNDCTITPDGKRVVAVGRSSLGGPDIWVLDIDTGEKLSTLEYQDWHDEARSCAISHDGSKLVVTCNEDVKLWDLINAREIHTFEGQSGYIRGCTIAPLDEGYLIAGSSYEDTGELFVWNMASKEVYWALHCFDHGIHSCAITRDGKTLITGAAGGDLKVWDLIARCELMTLRGHTGTVGGCAVTPDSKHLISASWDNTLKVWDLATGREIATLIGHGFPVADCEVTRDGKHLISASWDTTLKVWDLERVHEPQAKRNHQCEVHSCTVIADGEKVISASYDGTSKIWDIETGIELATLKGHKYAMMPDGKKVVSACDDGRLRIWDVETGTELSTIEGHRQPVKDCVVTPDGKIAISWSGRDALLYSDFTLKIWDLASCQELFVYEDTERAVNYCKVTPDGTKIILSLRRNMCRMAPPKVFILNLTDILAGSLNALFALSESYTSENCGITPDGKRIIFASYPNNTLKICDLETGDLTTLSSEKEGEGTFSGRAEDVLTVSPDGKRIISASGTSTITIWDCTTGQKLNTLRGHKWKVYACTFTPDGKYLVSGSHDHTLRVWNSASGCEISRLESAADFTCIAIAPNGRDIIAGDKLGNIHFLEFNPGHPSAK
jgi:WD40 repeat protein